MPRGRRKRGAFDFIIWFEDGARLEWKSWSTATDKEIADAIRRYLVPVAERIEARETPPKPPVDVESA